MNLREDHCIHRYPFHLERGRGDGSPVHPGSALSRAGQRTIDGEGEEPNAIWSRDVTASIVAPREWDDLELSREIAPEVIG